MFFTTSLTLLLRAWKIWPPLTSGVAASETARSLTTRLPDRLALPLFFSMASLLETRCWNPVAYGMPDGKARKYGVIRGGDERARAPRQPTQPASGHCARCAGRRAAAGVAGQ